jgi:hypothetical protein
MSKPLKRSFTFWAGLSGLVSLCWILVDSFFNRTQMLIPMGTARNDAVLMLSAGGVEVKWDENVDPPPVSSRGFTFGRRALSKRADFTGSKIWPPVSYERQSGWRYTGPPLPAGLSKEEAMERVLKGPSALFHHHTWHHALWIYLAGYLGLWGMALWVRRSWWRKRIASLGALETA